MRLSSQRGVVLSNDAKKRRKNCKNAMDFTKIKPNEIGASIAHENHQYAGSSWNFLPLTTAADIR
jgi:hypothetical protein